MVLGSGLGEGFLVFIWLRALGAFLLGGAEFGLQPYVYHIEPHLQLRPNLQVLLKG